MSRIILISGGTGVGTSKISLELAKTQGITNIVSTDSVREIIRSAIHPDLNPNLIKSTYQAGKTKNYEKKESNIKKTEIIRAYKNQCSAIDIGIQGLIRRSINENKSMIIEGVHLIPGKFKEYGVVDKFEEKVLEFLVYINSDKIHKERFNQRQLDAPQRQSNKYLQNFTEIRWIHDYLFERAKRYEHIKLINNENSLDNSVKEVLDEYNQFKKY